jgi:hypothetical protein
LSTVVTIVRQWSACTTSCSALVREDRAQLAVAEEDEGLAREGEPTACGR